MFPRPAHQGAGAGRGGDAGLAGAGPGVAGGAGPGAQTPPPHDVRPPPALDETRREPRQGGEHAAPGPGVREDAALHGDPHPGQGAALHTHGQVQCERDENIIQRVTEPVDSELCILHPSLTHEYRFHTMNGHKNISLTLK